MNNVTMIGRLTRDPELRFTAGSGKAVATFTIAVNRGFGKDEADFFRVVVWGKQGENCANYLAKGRKVAIQGRVQNNNYETSNGEKRYSTEIVAQTVEFLGGGNKNEGHDNGYNNTEHSNFLDDGSDGFQAIEDDDDIPF